VRRFKNAGAVKNSGWRLRTCSCYCTGAMPDIISYTRLRNELARALDRVTQDHAPLWIVRKRGKPAVLIAAEDYSALEETAYLLHSPRNAARLREAHEEIEKEIARRRRRAAARGAKTRRR